MDKDKTGAKIVKSTSIGKTSEANDMKEVLTVEKFGQAHTESVNDYKSDIKIRFDEVAEKYDKDRRYLLPCYDDFYSIPLKVLKEIHPEARKIADLGAGTGILSEKLLEIYPQAEFSLIELYTCFNHRHYPCE